MPSGGYADFRIIVFNYGTDTAEQIYNKLKDAYDAGKHLLVYIRDRTINKSYGVHEVESDASNAETFEIVDTRNMFDSQKLVIHRWIITKDTIQHKEHIYLLKYLDKDNDTIKEIQDKLNEVV